MFNFFGNSKLGKISTGILNSKKTYILLIIIILIQFILVSIIFFQLKKSKYIIEQTNFKTATVENQQKQLSTQLNSIQSSIMRMSAQLYRLQNENK